MKTSKIVCLLAAFLIAIQAFSQSTTSLERYLVARGVLSLCQAAHPANDYISGTYDINPYYVDVEMKSKDNVFGVTITTGIRIIKGKSNLFFSNLIVQNDDDMVKPFEAFGLQSSFLLELINAISPDIYKQMRDAIISSFNTNLERWTGRMWAILALNVDYYQYLLGK